MKIEKKLPTWLKHTYIDNICSNINNTLAHDLELRNSFFTPDKYDQCFMNLDLISHSENIFEYFLHLDDEIFENHASIYIYGLFQSFFTQQDAIVELEKIFSKEDKPFRAVCDKYFEYKETDENINPIKVIRWHRNNLIGHPTTRKVDKIPKFELKLNKKYFPNSKHNSDNKGEKQKLFFLGYGKNHTKSCIKYATYDPDFILLDVNLFEAIKNQRTFTLNFLNNLQNTLGIVMEEVN